jgi:Platelet-activating factor acetylhydrolase, isoform II
MHSSVLPNIIIALLLALSHALTLPPVSVSVETEMVVDHTRLDPLAPTKVNRAVMVSIFEPVPSAVCQWTTIPYMPPATASFFNANYSASFGTPLDLFSSISMQICSQKSLPSLPLPTIVFSHGLDGSRLFYNFMAASIASLGNFVVITVDHPYDAAVVEFPSGETVYATNVTGNPSILDLLDVRVEDLGFVQQQLGSRFVDAAAGGHSFGGASAVAALGSTFDGNPAFRGGLNLDGTLFGSIVTTGTRKPVLLFGHEGKDDPTWDTIWPLLTGWRREIELNGSQHNTFTDLPLIAKDLLNGAPPPAEWQTLLGTIDGARAMTVIVDFCVAFFNLVLRRNGGGLLSGPSTEFPEVEFVR